MAERNPAPALPWEETIVPTNDLVQMLVEARKRRRAAGERFLTDDEVDALLGRDAEDGRG